MNRPIPFTSLNKSIDKTGLSTFNQNQIDGYWQEYVSPDGPKLVWHKRPGFNEFVNLGENGPVDGLHYWTRQSLVYPVCNGKVFELQSDGTVSNVTGTAPMTPLVRPTFADVAGSSLYVASSGRIGAYPSGGLGAYLSSGNAPTSTRFISTLNRILIALRDNAERFDWANAGDPTTWDAEFATNETLPDITKAFRIANAYLYFWGQNSLELWRDDGVTFVRELQGAIQRGCLAAYSVTEIQGAFYWLDETREVIRLNGLSPEVISNPELTRYLRSFSAVADAKGDYLRISGKHFYVLSFPTEQKSLVYDITLNQWYEWSYWDTGSAEHQHWLGNCLTEATDWNKILVGDRRTGIIYEMSDAFTTDNGDTIRSVIRSDFVDHGAPDKYKSCDKLTLVFKRADTSTTPKKMLIRYRDEGSTNWTGSRLVTIEEQSKTELKVSERRFGRYKRRQWEFVMSDATQAALIGAWEDFSG